MSKISKQARPAAARISKPSHEAAFLAALDTVGGRKGDITLSIPITMHAGDWFHARILARHRGITLGDLASEFLGCFSNDTPGFYEALNGMETEGER